MTFDGFSIILVLAITLVIVSLVLFLYFITSIECVRYFRLAHIEHIDEKIYTEIYYNKPRVIADRRVVISLTTIPSRINKLKSTISSLLDTSVRVDQIYINIPYKTIKGKTYKIPRWLKTLHSDSGIIKIYRPEKDYGPATKLLPILSIENKDTIIIVVDDDVIYGSHLVEEMVKTFYDKGQDEAITTFGSDIKGYEPLNYNYPTFLRCRKGKYVDMVMGHNSFLVTPDMLPLEHIFNYDQAPKECIWVDDVWISGWLWYNRVKIWSIGYKYKTSVITMWDKFETSESLCKDIPPVPP